MIKWNKKNVPLESAKEISEKYGTDLLTASILIRRGVTDGKVILEPHSYNIVRFYAEQ